MTAALLSAAIGLLLLLMLIRMGMIAADPGDGGSRLIAINLSRAAEPASQVRRSIARAAPPQPHERVVQVRTVPQPQVPPLHLLKLSNEDMAAADISKMQRSSATERSGAFGAGSATAYGPGEGPGGAHLYNAEWYREPTRAELAGYMPQRDVSGGWAMIACRTEERYHVEDCRELGESPPGSGLSRALRQAAWQFLVRPPRLDGKPMIGAWVRIRFDFTSRPDHDEAAAEAAG
jgi:protein TonB